MRGYPQTDYLGDSGAGGSAELRVPAYFWDKLQFVGFFDGAYAELRRPAVGEHPSRTYTGVGGGIRINWPQNFQSRFEGAWPLGDKPSDGSSGQFYFSVAGEF